VISETVRRFGRIDTLVNNAGIFIAKPFTLYNEADFAAMISVNAAGFFHIRNLPQQKWRSGVAVLSSRSPPVRWTMGTQLALGARLADEGRPECGDTVACDRIRPARHSCERGRMRHWMRFIQLGAWVPAN